MNEPRGNRSGRILVVEDDEALSEALAEALTAEGHQVHVRRDGEGALSAVESLQPHLIVLDLGLPDADGVGICRVLRAREVSAAVLILTGRGASSDRVIGLDAGADDYLAKPFDLAEFLARVRALLRRAAVDPGEVLSACGITIDRDRRRVTRDGRPVDLTRVEFALLEHLVRHTGKVLTRDDLYTAVWGIDFATASRSLDVHISYLRAKLEESGERRVIETVRGVGFTLRCPT